MPYGYYQLVRILALIGFSILAYLSFKEERYIEMILYIGLAILFQPLIKIALGRFIWNVVDVIVGIALIVSVFVKNNAKKIKLNYYGNFRKSFWQKEK